MSLRNPPPQTYTPLAMSTSPVKIYHTQPSANEWKYYGHRGILVFGQETQEELSFRLFACNDDGEWSTLWTYRLPASKFEYNVDSLPSFHWFNGLTRKYGLLFEDDGDADVFARVLREQASQSESPSPKHDGRSRLRGRGFMSTSVLSLRLSPSSSPEPPRPSTFPQRSASKIWGSLRRKPKEISLVKRRPGGAEATIQADEF